MKSLLCTIFLVFFVALLAAGCARDTTPAPAAINTAIAATRQAEVQAQATLNAAVLTAMPPTATPMPTVVAQPSVATPIVAVQATVVAPAPTAVAKPALATPTPGPTPVYVTLTEEEMVALIDAAVAEAIAASDETVTIVYTTTADDALTAEEAAYIYNYYAYADYYVEEAEELLAVYYGLYDELANEMLAELSAIADELAQLNTTLASIDQSLQQISATLAQGLAITEETIAQLESAAQTAQAHADKLQAQSQNMAAVLQLDQQHRLDEIAQMQPNNIPDDRLSALQSAFAFVDAANSALADDKLTQAELHNLTQLGKNAQAGLPQLSRGTAGAARPNSAQLTGKFDQISQQLARGQTAQGRASIGQMEHALGQRPAAPALPEKPASNIPAPSGGGRGSRPSRP